MLSEGLDAGNVTQIPGLRAFQPQLLCEQVVGRLYRLASDSAADVIDNTFSREEDASGLHWVARVRSRDAVVPQRPAPLIALARAVSVVLGLRQAAA